MPSPQPTASPFDLPERLHRKAAPALIGRDEEHFAAVRAALTSERERVRHRLDTLRREPAAAGQRALERDLEIQQLAARLRVLDRFGLDACIGRMVDDAGTVTYLGRFGLAGPDERRLLTDWRAPASAPFFAASGADRMGLTSRRRYRWRAGRIVDYWDEVFAPDGVDHSAALDDESAFIASLGASRSPRMRDVLATIQSDQDAIIRADSRGALVVDGGPGTGKTVVALHRAAYLLYADTRLQDGHGGLLFVGPHRPYVDYVDDVLPSLGEEGALVCALADLVPGGADVPAETDAEVRRIKGDARLVDAVEAAVRVWQRPPRRTVVIETAWGTLAVAPEEWAEVFADADTLPHNVLRTEAWERLLDLLEARVGDERGGGSADDGWGEGWGDASRRRDDFDAYGAGWDDDESVREALENDDELRALFDRMWPLLDPDALLRGMLSSADLLHRCAPYLTDAEAAAVARAGSSSWTDVDLALLDAVRRAIGDPRGEARRRRARWEEAEAQRLMSDVVTDLIAADDGDLRIMSMLRGQDLRRTLAQPAASDIDPLAGPFAHLVVDEAQELTDAQWRMLLSRCPSGSLTIVGDRAQARHGFAESWVERLERVGIPRTTVATLTVNYRTPEEVMAVAGPVIRAALPDANVPLSIRRTGVAVRRGRRRELDGILTAWEREHDEGTAVVIGDPGFAPRDRVRSLSPELVKGLEFDLVVLVDPDGFGTGVAGAVDRYVAMTRATQQLVILT
ncbi:RNA polymerase recycling motor ATPase HelR [Microbacterium aurum]